jgi:hypothetical protein
LGETEWKYTIALIAGQAFSAGTIESNHAAFRPGMAGSSIVPTSPMINGFPCFDPHS